MRIGDPGSVLIARQLFEGLTRWDPRRQRVMPAAARSWSVSDGGRSFVFELRREMRFHDGTPVTARSFEFAFDRIARKENASDIAYTLQRVRGFRAVNGRGTRRHLAGVKVLGRHRLRITLSVPWREFPAVLTHPGLVPISPRAVRRYDAFLARPIGNGPYRMQRRWTHDGPVVLAAFDSALDQADVERLRFLPFRDASASWRPFAEGRIDVAEVPTDQVSFAAGAYGTRGYRPLLAGLYFGLRLKAAPLRSKEVRIAISRAIDRESIARRIYGRALQRPRGIVPRGVPGFAAESCAHLCSHDRRAAARLVARVPRARRTVRIDFDVGKLQERVARAVAHDLARARLRARLRPAPLRRFLRRLGAGEVEMYRFGWIAEYPTPDAFLSALFGSRSPDNHSGFASSRVDSLLRRARAERLRRVRTRLYRRAEALILEAVPVVPIGSFRMHWAAQPWVRDIHFDEMGGFDARTITLTAG